jgi:hypothetical protein
VILLPDDCMIVLQDTPAASLLAAPCLQAASYCCKAQHCQCRWGVCNERLMLRVFFSLNDCRPHLLPPLLLSPTLCLGEKPIMWLVLAKILPQGVEELELPAAPAVAPAGLSSRSRCPSLGVLSAAGEAGRAAGAVSSVEDGTRGLVAMGLSVGPASKPSAMAQPNRS